MKGKVIKINSIIPEGTRDFTIDECIKRKEIIKVTTDVFTRWGYREISTPTIEYYETFNHKTQSLKEEEMYKFFDNRGRILVLRPDMTVPVARMVNTKLKDMSLPIKLFYCSNVFRVHESLGGKRNEYLDCGIEFIGIDNKYSDLEVLVTALECLKSIGNDDFKLEIGNVNILKSALDEIGLSGKEKMLIMELINKKSLTTLKEKLRDLNISEENKNFLNKLPWLFGGYEMIEKAKELSVSKEMYKNIKYIEEIFLSLKELGYEKYITVDMSMVPRVNYYSGIIFKGYVNGIGNTVLRGGRYDELMGSFGEDIPAIGFAIDINSLVDTISESQNEIIDKNKININSSNFIEKLKEAIIKTEKGENIEIIYK